ncbi:MAG TPA: ABC transporter permease [Methylomirabilota bacterium]|nr:ABC transporter permease [Methylomirabilota bacterium]
MHKLTQRYRYSYILLRQLVKSDFKLRYQGSVLGYAWSLLRPLFLFIILYIVFAKFLKVGGTIPHYPVYLLLGIVLWNYFTEVTAGSVSAIVGSGDLIRKINFPKYVLILAGSFSAFINLLLNFIVIGFFMVLTHVALTSSAIIMIPLIIELFVFSIAVAFFLSALYVKFRDVLYIWEVIIQGAFYATPILYPLSLIPDKAAKILILNPMAQIIQDARYVLVTKDTDTIYTLWGGDRWIWLIPIGITVVTALAAAAYFRKQSKYFAEEV